jgi:hypothetical protein
MPLEYAICCQPAEVSVWISWHMQASQLTGVRFVWKWDAIFFS